MPDTAGTYVIETQVGLLAQGTVIPAYESNVEITVEKDAASLTADIIAALNALSVSKKDRAMMQDAIKWLQQGHHGNKEELDQDIYDILKAVDAVVQIENADITQIRLMLDNLLRVEEWRYYFSAPNEHGKDH
jgi:low affinity Fe/Cu permease